jgi:hypothetical protein
MLSFQALHAFVLEMIPADEIMDILLDFAPDWMPTV